MSSSSAAFFCENFAGTVSVFVGAPGTAKAPLTNAAFDCGCVSAAAKPPLPIMTRAIALVRRKSRRMIASLRSASRSARDRSTRGHCLRQRALPPRDRAEAPGGQYADITTETGFGFAPRIRAANPGPRLVIVARLIRWCPRNVSLVDPSLRARRHGCGNEGEREPCGADKRWHGTSCISIEDRLLTP